MKEKKYTIVGSKDGDGLKRLIVEADNTKEVLDYVKDWNYYDIYIGEYKTFPIKAKKMASK